ncbi:MAG TPA: 4-(cytidine 5'-diphospho)-2-C-methyl-D-erythritol kinase [Xanthomonadales bacterium]|nr:4-(cytidine 5'-diphospho)-2-C-methyl-D-erythritol kinase [Xanthomonadales bacterium]
MTEPYPAGWPAPAKLNLFLHVTGRRPDGYHDIQTLFQLIDLADELSFEVNDSGKIRRTGSRYGVAESQDLVVRAARLLQSQAQTHKGVRISVKKRIPLGAGLGGGSSDAATTLLALNKLWNCQFGMDELASMGLSLGADVPVFILGHSALATGIGERLQFVDLGPRHYLLVLSERAISTAEIFERHDLERNSPVISLFEALEGAGRNDCEAVVRAMFPDLEEMFRELKAWGQPRLTGTGSSIFLPMCDEKAAHTAAREIKCRYNVRVVRGLNRSPVHDMLDSSFR